MIENKFITFNTLAGFKAALSRNQVGNKSIVFIKDPAMIWTHGTFFDATKVKNETTGDYDLQGSDRILLTEEAYEQLVANDQIDNNTYYLTYEES